MALAAETWAASLQRGRAPGSVGGDGPVFHPDVSLARARARSAQDLNNAVWLRPRSSAAR
jgi:hypothetical protein